MFYKETDSREFFAFEDAESVNFPANFFVEYAPIPALEKGVGMGIYGEVFPNFFVINFFNRVLHFSLSFPRLPAGKAGKRESTYCW